MSVDTAAATDAGEWEELSRDEQREILDQGWTEQTGEAVGDEGDGISTWENVDEVSQQETLDALQGALEDTWIAPLFGNVPSRRTIPFEMLYLRDDQQDDLEKWAGLFAELEEVGEVDNITDVEELAGHPDVSDDIEEELEAFEPWLNEYLADITVGETFTRDWWSVNTNYPAETRIHLFIMTLEKFRQQKEQIQSFQ